MAHPIGTLYGFHLSPNLYRPLLVANHVGVEVKLVEVDILTKENKKDAFLALQPFGEVPAFETEDKKVHLFESRAVARYFDAIKGGHLLQLNDPAQYGLVETWASVEASNFDRPAFALTVEIVFKPAVFKQQPDQAEVKKLKDTLSKVLDVYEKQLSKKSYLTGDKISIADLFHVPLLYYLTAPNAEPDLVDNHPNVKKWWNKLSSLPAWKKTLEQTQGDVEKFFK